MAAFDTEAYFLESIQAGIASDGVSYRDLDAEFDGLAALLVSLIQGHDADRLTNLSRRLQSLRARSRIVTPSGGSMEAHIGAFIRLAVKAVAATLPAMRDPLSDLHRKILEEARGQSRSSGEIADSLTMAPSTIARELPSLRTAGMLRSWKVGSRMQNLTTPAGEQALDAFRTVPVPVHPSEGYGPQKNNRSEMYATQPRAGAQRNLLHTGELRAGAQGCEENLSIIHKGVMTNGPEGAAPPAPVSWRAREA